MVDRLAALHHTSALEVSPGLGCESDFRMRPDLHGSAEHLWSIINDDSEAVFVLIGIGQALYKQNGLDSSTPDRCVRCSCCLVMVLGKNDHTIAHACQPQCSLSGEHELQTRNFVFMGWVHV